MKRTLALLAISTAMSFSSATQAVEFPGWSYNQTCNAGDTICVRFEQRARGEISGTWRTLPTKQQADCIAETEKVVPSYRLLQTCLANAMQELLRDQHRKPPVGKVVHKTPMAKRPEPPAPAPTPEPAPAAPAPTAPAAEAPATPAPSQ